jgi:Fe-S cluster assembly protein SufD
MRARSSSAFVKEIARGVRRDMILQCASIATSGQIEEDQLFYLRSRSIPTKTAQRLLVTGFLDEVIQRLNHPAISNHLHRLIEEKFNA